MSGILTVCTANVCRSAGAAALLDSLLPPAVAIRSAGVAAHDGQGLCPVTRQWLVECGVDAGTEHHSRQVNKALVGDADLVLVTSLRQRKLVLALTPQAPVFTLREAAWLARQLPADGDRHDTHSAVPTFAHDLTALRHRTRFADAGRETVTVQHSGGGRRLLRSRTTTEVAVSPYDVPDAHSATMHGDHAPTFATLEPAVRTIAERLRAYLPETSGPRHGTDARSSSNATDAGRLAALPDA